VYVNCITRIYDDDDDDDDEQQNLRKRLRLTDDDDDKTGSKPSDADESHISSDPHCRVPLTMISNQPTVRSTHVRHTRHCSYQHSFTLSAFFARLLC